MNDPAILFGVAEGSAWLAAQDPAGSSAAWGTERECRYFVLAEIARAPDTRIISSGDAKPQRR